MILSAYERFISRSGLNHKQPEIGFALILRSKTESFLIFDHEFMAPSGVVYVRRMIGSFDLHHHNEPVKTLDYAAFLGIVNPEDVNLCQFFHHEDFTIFCLEWIIFNLLTVYSFICGTMKLRNH